MDYIKNINKDEIRSGFLVTSDRKKIWQKLMEMMVLFDEICQKHAIRYYISYGTLIGAIRHGGFIPWDNDVDYFVPRPDYERLKLVMPDELKPPYTYVQFTNYTFYKLRDMSTTGISLDMFPLDLDYNPAGSYSDEQMLAMKTFEELYELFLSPNHLAGKIINEGYQPVLPLKTLEKLALTSQEYRFKLFEEAAARLYDATDYCNYYVE